VHKIRDADVRQQPHFCERAATILEIFKDSDILGFNSSRFDVPFLEVRVLKA
jgi:DNA polymerase III epsilon subunit-like protein